VAVVCENYPESQITKKNFTDIQRAIGRLVDELPEEGFTTRLVDSYWLKGQLLWSAIMNRPRTGWLPRYLPSWPERAPGSS